MSAQEIPLARRLRAAVIANVQALPARSRKRIELEAKARELTTRLLRMECRKPRGAM